MQDVDIRIRGARLSDAANLATLMCQLGYETTPIEMETRLRAVLNNSAFTTLLAEFGGEVCGMVGTISQTSYEHNDLSGRILALIVSKNGRRRGIGRALVAAAEKEFARKSVRRISLTTQLTRKDAHQFYEALGYERNGWRFVKEQPPTAG